MNEQTVGRPTPLPEPPLTSDVRSELARELLSGDGVEIGALHRPMIVPDTVSVRYMDRMTVPDLRRHYQELASLDLTPVDIVDNGETLATIPDESVDFIIANHFLEHCEDPIRTLSTHLGKLRGGGILFYAVPDKRYTFDFQREVTPLEHLKRDHARGPAGSRASHYLEWVTLVDASGGDAGDPADLQRAAQQLDAADYSIHFHVWTQQELLELFLYLRTELGGFDIAAFRPHGMENIVVLRKDGGEPDLDPETVAQVVAGLRTPQNDLDAVPDGFDPTGYLTINPDVLAAGVDPYTHFVQHGRDEGRRW